MSQQAAPDTPATTTFNILFVCTGNTCRSPQTLPPGIRAVPAEDVRALVGAIFG